MMADLIPTDPALASYHPIPPPRDDSIYPNLTSLKEYLDKHASSHGFIISTLDTRKTAVYYKCSLGDHRHETKAKAAAKEGKSPSSKALQHIKTCPFRVTARRLRNSDRFRIELTDPNHDHGPHVEIRNPPHPPHQLQTQQHPLIPVAQPAPPPHQPVYLTQRYQELFNEMQSFSEKAQGRLITRFLRDCEIAKDVAEADTVGYHPQITRPETLKCSNQTINPPTQTITTTKNVTIPPDSENVPRKLTESKPECPRQASPVDALVTPPSPSSVVPPKATSPLIESASSQTHNPQNCQDTSTKHPVSSPPPSIAPINPVSQQAKLRISHTDNTFQPPTLHLDTICESASLDQIQRVSSFTSYFFSGPS